MDKASVDYGDIEKLGEYYNQRELKFWGFFFWFISFLSAWRFLLLKTHQSDN